MLVTDIGLSAHFASSFRTVTCSDKSLVEENLTWLVILSRLSLLL